MAILRLSNGEVYVTYQDINKIIAPAGMTVGQFPYPEALEAKVAEMSKPLTKESLDLVFGEMASSVEGILKDANYSYAACRGAVYVPPETKGGNCAFSMAFAGMEEPMNAEMNESDTSDFKLPHVLRTDNWHFAFASAFVKGMQLEGDLQAMIYVTAGEWQRLDSNILTWVIFTFGEPVVGLSYFVDEPNAQGKWETDVAADHVILDTMKF